MNQQNELVIIIRPSFKKICGPDACRAAIYNHILYRLARKSKDEPEEKVKRGEVFWFASAEDICKDMDEAWCVNKIRKEIKPLVESGLIGQRHNPTKKWDRKFQYFISEEQGIKLLEKCRETDVCLLHIGLNSEVLHLLYMVNAFDKNGACICPKSGMDVPNMVVASAINGGAIPEGSTKGSSEESNQECVSVENSVTSDSTPVHTHTPALVSPEENQETSTDTVQHEQVVAGETQPSANNAHEAASRLPQGNTEKPSPPHPDKTNTNKQPLSRQELALRRKWAKYVSDDISREVVLAALALRGQWIDAYGPYGDSRWSDEALVWIAQQHNGTFESIQSVYELLTAEAVSPEMIKNNWYRLSGRRGKKQTAPPPTMLQRVPTREEMRKEPV